MLALSLTRALCLSCSLSAFSALFITIWEKCACAGALSFHFPRLPCPLPLPLTSTFTFTLKVRRHGCLSFSAPRSVPLSLSRSRCGNFLCGLPVLFSQLIRPPAGALVLRAAPPRKVCYARSLLIFPRRPAGATLLPLLLLRAVIMAVRCKDQGRSRKSTAKNENKNKPEKKKQSQGKVNRKKCRALAFVRMVWSFLGRMTLTRVAGFEWGT